MDLEQIICIPLKILKICSAKHSLIPLFLLILQEDISEAACFRRDISTQDRLAGNSAKYKHKGMCDLKAPLGYCIKICKTIFSDEIDIYL